MPIVPKVSWHAQVSVQTEDASLGSWPRQVHLCGSLMTDVCMRIVKPCFFVCLNGLFQQSPTADSPCVRTEMKIIWRWGHMSSNSQPKMVPFSPLPRTHVDWPRKFIPCTHTIPAKDISSGKRPSNVATTSVDSGKSQIWGEQILIRNTCNQPTPVYHTDT